MEQKGSNFVEIPIDLKQYTNSLSWFRDEIIQALSGGSRLRVGGLSDDDLEHTSYAGAT